MDKVLRLKSRVDVRRHPGQRVVSLTLDHETIPEWTLGLCLLSETLVDRLIVLSTDSPFVVRLTSSGGSGKETRSRLANDSLNLELTTTEMGRWRHFFLNYVRDGVAEVDHLDLDLAADGDNDSLTLTLKVQRAAPAISPEESRRRLGL